MCRDRSVLGKAIPAASDIKTFLLLACIVRQSSGLGSSKTRPGGLLRESHPSEDLSELPPLRDPAFAGLWLGRGIIVGGCCHGETGCQTCFCLDGYTLVTLLAVVYAKTRTGGPGASDARSLIR